MNAYKLAKDSILIKSWITLSADFISTSCELYSQMWEWEQSKSTGETRLYVYLHTRVLNPFVSFLYRYRFIQFIWIFLLFLLSKYHVYTENILIHMQQNFVYKLNASTERMFTSSFCILLGLSASCLQATKIINLIFMSD